MNSPRSLRRGVLLLLMAALSVLMALPVSAQLLRPEPEAPAVATFAKNGTPREVFTFSADDFLVENSDVGLDSIVLASLPDSNAGVLTLGGIDLAAGEAVALEAVSGMAFTPNSAPTVATTSFSFTPVFADGSAGADVTVDLYLLTAENSTPIARDLALSTYKNVAVQGQFSAVDPEGELLTFRLADKPARGAVTLSEDGARDLALSTYKNVAVQGQFSAVDPEGELLTFRLADKPARGAVTLSEDGSAFFTYTPYENKTGKDSFTYVAVDAVGNVSEPATVKVKIEKANTKVTYSDMEGRSAHCSALRLAEEGILIGECMGGAHFFQPDLPVSREEFVALAMHIRLLHLYPL